MNRFATERLHIRPLQLPDSADVFAYRSDPEVVRYQMWRPASEREVARFIRELRGLAPGMPGIWFQFAIIEHESGALIGDCGVHVPLDDPDSVELGLTLRADAQGKGYATEALRGLIGYCFLTLHVHRVIARTHPDNSPSIALIGRCGFSPLPARSEEPELVYELKHKTWRSGFQA
jgi:RimJ/RimL family protein N-acetyltransferase